MTSSIDFNRLLYSVKGYSGLNDRLVLPRLRHDVLSIQPAASLETSFRGLRTVAIYES